MGVDILQLLSNDASEFVRNPKTISDEAKAIYTSFRDGALLGYMERTPYAVEGLRSLKADGARILNDHVALRTFKDEQGTSGRRVFEKLFLAYGYRKENDITIGALHLDCTWYEPPQDTSWPKIFISEQQVSHLPAEAKKIVYESVGSYLSDDPFTAIDLDNPEQVNPSTLVALIDTPPWNLSSEQYDRLLLLADENPNHKKALQYTAWTLVNGHRWNHLTILQNTLDLPSIDNLEKLDDYLREKGLPLNKSEAGEIQGSAEVNLKQSSTIANKITHTFSDGEVREVPGSFVEFIERFKVDDVPFRGFLAGNALGIFSSTDAKKNRD